jgi:hypothetical protein
MKKNVLVVLLIISILLIVACKSPPPAAEITETAEITEVTDETFRTVFVKYIDDLIIDGAINHEVKSGDTVIGISLKYYDHNYFFPIIMLASKYVVLDPDKINPGMVLIVPNLEVNLNDPVSRAAIINVMMEYADIEDARGKNHLAQSIRDHAHELK